MKHGVIVIFALWRSREGLMGKLAFLPVLEVWVKCVNDEGEREPGWTCQEGGETEATKAHCVL